MRITILLIVLVISGCASQHDAISNQGGNVELSQSEQLLAKGYALLIKHDAKEAIEKYFNKIIDQCDTKYSNLEKKVYASRSQIETLYYMMKAASEKQAAIAVDSTCAEALYLKGYASLDLGNIKIAEEHIKRAVTMSPVNSMYLSELGHIYQLSRDWERALVSFNKAEEYAENFSPPEVRNIELGRAKRGIGYIFIELGKLDKAEEKFRECLELNRNDKAAINELKYIEKNRSGK